VLYIPARLTKKEQAAVKASSVTKLKMLKRLVIASIWFAGTAIALLQFSFFARIGTALLASAGVVGLVFGLAARTTLGDAVAGLMIAFSQPIRLKDWVLIDGEYGQVEEMTLIHTIIKTWDNRRVIVPNEKLSTNIIRNYSLRTNEILAETIIYIPYSNDLNKCVGLIKKQIKASKYWFNKEEPQVEVCEFLAKSIKLRVLAYAKNPEDAHRLSVDIKEKVAIAFQKAKLPLGE